MLDGSLVCTCHVIGSSKACRKITMALLLSFFLSQQALKATYTQGPSFSLFHGVRNSESECPSVSRSLGQLMVNSTITLHHYRLTRKVWWLINCTDYQYLQLVPQLWGLKTSTLPVVESILEDSNFLLFYFFFFAVWIFFSVYIFIDTGKIGLKIASNIFICLKYQSVAMCLRHRNLTEKSTIASVCLDFSLDFCIESCLQQSDIIVQIGITPAVLSCVPDNTVA